MTPPFPVTHVFNPYKCVDCWHTSLLGLVHSTMSHLAPGNSEGYAGDPALSKRDRVSELLQNASAALNLSLALAPLIPLPIVSSIVSSASLIVEALKVNHCLDVG